MLNSFDQPTAVERMLDRAYAGEHVSEWITARQATRGAREYLVHVYTVHPGPCYLQASVWEPEAGHHTTMTARYTTGSHGHRDVELRVGRVGTRPLSADVDALPYGDERTGRVRVHHTSQFAEAEAVLRLVVPELWHAPNAMTSWGELTVPLIAGVRPRRTGR